MSTSGDISCFVLFFCFIIVCEHISSKLLHRSFSVTKLPCYVGFLIYSLTIPLNV